MKICVTNSINTFLFKIFFLQRSNDEKQLIQYSKLSGFLLKLALKIIDKFWQYLHLDHFETIYNLVSSIYNYSPEFLEKQLIKTQVKDSIQTCLVDVISSFVEDKLFHEDLLEQVSEIDSFYYHIISSIFHIVEN